MDEKKIVSQSVTGVSLGALSGPLIIIRNGPESSRSTEVSMTCRRGRNKKATLAFAAFINHDRNLGLTEELEREAGNWRSVKTRSASLQKAEH